MEAEGSPSYGGCLYEWFRIHVEHYWKHCKWSNKWCVLRPLGIQRWWRCVCCLSLPFKNALFVQCYCYTEVKQTVLRSLQWCPFTGLPSLGVDVLDMGLWCLQAAQCFPLCAHLIHVGCVWARGFRYKHQSKSGFLLGTSEINSKGFGAALTVFL